jgi:hypothetical protein
MGNGRSVVSWTCCEVARRAAFDRLRGGISHVRANCNCVSRKLEEEKSVLKFGNLSASSVCDSRCLRRKDEGERRGMQCFEHEIPKLEISRLAVEGSAG